MDWPVSSVQNEHITQGDSVSRALGSWDMTPSVLKSPVALPGSGAVREG